MIEYLRGTPLTLPRVATSTAPDAKTPHGTLTPGFARGELFLVAADGTSYRLAWDGSEEGAARRRALPAGEYALRTYRIERDKDGVPWHLSASAHEIRKVVVRAGEDTLVSLREAIRIRAGRHGDQAQMDIQGEDRAGLSLYKDGKRIPIRYRVVDESGKSVAAGDMRYG